MRTQFLHYAEDALPLLNKKERIFALEMINSGNAIKAALKAGYTIKSAHSAGHKLARLPKIQRFMEEEYQKILEDGRRARSLSLLRRLDDLATGCLHEAIAPDGTIKPVSQWTRRVKNCVNSYSYTRDKYGSIQPKITIVDPLKSVIEEYKLLNPPPIPGQSPQEETLPIVPVLEGTVLERIASGLSPQKRQTLLAEIVPETSETSEGPTEDSKNQLSFTFEVTPEESS